MTRVIEVRKLAAVDVAWAGARLILAEYVFGVLLPLGLGVLSLGAGLADPQSTCEVALGVWLVGIGLNYIPLAVYAIDLTRRGQVEAEGQPEIARARRYGAQQVMILVSWS